MPLFSDTEPKSRQGSAGVMAEVVDDLPQGVLSVNSDGVVTFANRSALSLFPEAGPIGIKLLTLLDMSGISNGRELAEATQLRTPSAPIRIDLPDGRVLDSRSFPLANGDTVVTLLDVSLYAGEAALMYRDPLTGLANRAGLKQRLSELLAESRQRQFAVISVDLNRFKAINDTLGHPMGDALLVKVADRLRNALRPGDLVARTDGDEFVILQCGAQQPQAAAALAVRLVDLIGRTYVISGQMLNIGVSVGVAMSPGDGEDADGLLKHADLALHRAKTEGRGIYRFFQTSMDAEMQAHRLLELDLRNALTLKEFELRYQPQFQIEPRRLLGFEALLRWRTPERGLVSPADFVPLAEQTGLIVPIGDWVLNTACLEAASWPVPVSVGVNVSALQFHDDLVKSVSSALQASGLDPGRLELEILEDIMITNTESALAQLNAMKELGVRVAIDDFGTGFSSLTYLRKFPFDRIKIDQSFVRNSSDDVKSMAIIRSVAALGKSLGIATIVEGVETEEQLARVEAAGCTQIQGYLFGKPVEAAAAMALLVQTTVPSSAKGERP